MSFAVRAWLSVLLLAATAYGGYSFWRHYQASQTTPTFVAFKPSVDAEFDPTDRKQPKDYFSTEAVERSGRTFRFEEMKGKVWLASFFFASCPGSCRQINTSLSGLQHELDGKDVTIVSITVEPDKDTPESLSAYANAYKADTKRWLFVTGEHEKLKAMCVRGFEMSYGERFGAPSHHDRVTLVDQNGERQGTYNVGKPEHLDALKKRIDELLADAKERS
jgi:cytochrome oxidase Cu insertion factor (SCO1/SenC/PrrC family)